MYKFSNMVHLMKKARLYRHGMNKDDMEKRKAQALIRDDGDDDRKCLICNSNGNTVTL